MHSLILVVSLVVPSAAHLNVDVTLRAETRGGVVRADPTLGVISQQHEFTPGIAANYASGPWRFTGEYINQVQLRNPGQEQSALLLHQGTVRAERYTKRGDVVQVQIGGLAGQLDYARATRLVFEQGAGLLASFPNDSRVVDYGNGDASLNLILRNSRRSSTVLGFGAGYTGPLAESSQGLVLRQWRTNLFAQQRYLLTSKDTLVGEVALARVSFESGPLYLGASPSASYIRRISSLSELVVQLGAQVTHTQPVGTVDGPTPAAGSSWMPVGRASLTGTLARTRTLLLRGEAGAGVTPFYDPFRASLLPRSVLNASLTLVGPSRFETTLGASWYQTLNRGAVLNADADLAGQPFGTPRETLIAATLNIQRPIFNSFGADLGGIMTARSDNLPGSNRNLSQPEFLGYFALTANIDLWN